MKMVEQFKRRILDLAIRGKLVPQDPNDESASVLLERIREERAELVKAGKIKKDKQPSRIVIGSDGAAYEKLTSTPPFRIPKNWLWVQMDSISESINVGIVIRPKRYYTSKDEGTPAFRNCNIQGGSIDDSEWVYLKATAAKENPRSVVRYGDVLIARSGNAGNCCVVPKTYSGYGAIDVIIARPLLKFVSPDFLAVNLCAASTQTMLASISRGVALSHLGVTTISSLPMPLPPLTEQKRIVAKVKELFAIADSLGVAADGLENAAKRLDKKILDLAIRGKLVPQDPDDEPASELVKRITASHKSPYGNGKAAQARRAQRNDSLSAASTPLRDDPPPPFDIPNSWEWVRLGDVSKIVRGSGIKRNETSASGVQCVRYGEIYTHYSESFNKAVSFVPQTVADKCHEAKFGDVLCTLTGENEVEIAKATAYLGHEKLVIGGDLARISDHPYVPILLAYFMFSPFMISQKASVCTGGMIVHMGKAALSNLFIPLPPLAEQKRIVAKIEALRSVLKSFFM